MAFELTMTEPDRGRGPWQVSHDNGSTWWGCTRDAGRRLILAARLPLDRFEVVEDGGVVILREGVLLRRRPSTVEVQAASRQIALFA